MDKIKSVLLLLNFVCLGVLIFLFIRNNKISNFGHVDISKEFELKQDSIQNKLDSFKLEGEYLIEKINNHQVEKTIIKNYYYEKISSVDTISDDSLKQFFTDRYK